MKGQLQHAIVFGIGLIVGMAVGQRVLDLARTVLSSRTVTGF